MIEELKGQIGRLGLVSLLALIAQWLAEVLHLPPPSILLFLGVSVGGFLYIIWGGRR